MRIIPIILLVLSLAECRHYFVRDAAKYNLTQEEENLLKSKKIGVIGFHPSYRSRYSDCCQMSKNIVRVLQFIYLTTDSESLPLKPNAFMKGIGKYRIFHKLSERNTFNELLKFRNVEENKHKPNKKQKFDDVFNKTIMSFFNERFDFFKKVDDPKTKDFISQVFFEGLRNHYESQQGTT